MLGELQRHLKKRESFAFETTLAGKVYLRHIGVWQAAGYRVELIFLKLSNVDEAVARVAQRVKQGGHNIPEAVIRRRFTAGLENFTQHYALAVDAWALYDNSGEQPRLLDWRDKA